jgi:hypothetical protein
VDEFSTDSDANWPIDRPHKSKGAEQKMERPDKSAAKFWPIMNRKAEKALSFKKIVSLLLSSLIIGKSKKFYYFSTTTDKNSVFY